MTYPISKFWFYPLCRLFIGKIKGIENIPTNTSFIVVANHEKLVDPLYIIYVILRKLNKKTHFLATPTWWFLGESICRDWAGCVPLVNSKQAYKETKKYIKSGKIVGIFPEGHLKARIRYPKVGALKLALETNTPILPIGLKSSYIPFNSGVNIGKLVYISKKKPLEKQIIEIMKKIYELKENIS